MIYFELLWENCKHNNEIILSHADVANVLANHGRFRVKQPADKEQHKHLFGLISQST